MKNSPDLTIKNIERTLPEWAIEAAGVNYVFKTLLNLPDETVIAEVAKRILLFNGPDMRKFKKENLFEFDRNDPCSFFSCTEPYGYDNSTDDPCYHITEICSFLECEKEEAIEAMEIEDDDGETFCYDIYDICKALKLNKKLATKAYLNLMLN